MRDAYRQQLQDLRDKLLIMGSMASRALGDSIDALKTQDLDEARRIIAEDKRINGLKFEIEDEVLALIAMQQPMAGDMRLLAAMLEISGELERIGDYAKGIGRIVVYMDGHTPLKPLVDIPRMYEIVVDMLQRALDAFINHDVEAARNIPLEDDVVDALYNQINSELIMLIMANPSQIEQANYLTWAAHNLERAADRVTNICERIIYTETGVFREIDATEFGVSGMN
jgi:phosphate transport system protein